MSLNEARKNANNKGRKEEKIDGEGGKKTEKEATVAVVVGVLLETNQRSERTYSDDR